MPGSLLRGVLLEDLPSDPPTIDLAALEANAKVAALRVSLAIRNAAANVRARTAASPPLCGIGA
jgi:hypothetical protein